MSLLTPAQQFDALSNRKSDLFKELTAVNDDAKSRAFTVAKAKSTIHRLDLFDTTLRLIQRDIIEHNSYAEKDLKVKRDFSAFTTVLNGLYDACYTVIEADASNRASLLDASQQQSTSQQATNQLQGASSSKSPSLPKIRIEPFDGNIANYGTFKSLYDELIHKAALSDIEKFSYLQSLTKKEANTLVTQFEFLPENYKSAYDALANRYSNSRRLGNYYFQHLLRANNTKDIVSFLEANRTCTNNLKSLNAENLADYLLFEFVYNNCSPSWKKSFEMEFKGDKLPTLAELLTHLERLARIDELKIDTDAKPKPVQKQRALVISNPEPKSEESKPSKQKKICFLCSSDHTIYQCPTFHKLSAPDKVKTIKSFNHCVNCLAKHDVAQCGSSNRCRVCQDTHHTFLHVERTAAPQPAALQLPPVPQAVPQPSTSTSLACSSQQPTLVLLGTVRVLIQDRFGHFHPARGVLDPASECNFVSLELCQALGLQRHQDSNRPSGIGEVETRTFGQARIRVRSTDEAFEYSCSASVLDVICGELPSVSVPADVNPFKNVPLADATFHLRGKIDFLLGVQAYVDLMSFDVPNILPGPPMACKTKLGWILLGAVPQVSEDCASRVSLLIQNPSIDKILNNFFEIEEVREHPCTLSPEEELCVSIFQASKSRDDEGRYTVPLLFNPTRQPELNNRSAAMSSYHRLERRLARDDSLSRSYQAFMQEYVAENHMRPINDDEEPSPYVLPQHCVKKETSSTTKVRVVFNGSHNGFNGQCLNSFLMCGPKVQPDLVQVLLTFRVPKVALVADVKMLYRQIQIQDSDTQYLRVFYRQSHQEDIQEMVHLRVVYGLKSSSFLAQASLADLATQEEEQFPLAAQAIKRSTVMDDVCTGGDSIEEAIELRNQLVALLQRGCFPLRKWVSSHPEVLTGLPQEDLEKPLSFDDGSPIFKILGLLWLPDSDSFSFRVHQFEGTPTKRSLLSYLARIFDPLGLIGPCVFYAKKIIQQLWLLNLSWDDPLPANVRVQWDGFLCNIEELSQLRVPRWLQSAGASVSLVGFCDGSNAGFAACIYAVARQSDTIQSTLLISKSRLAPLKNLQSIPRIELLGAHLLAQLLAYVLQSQPEFASDPTYLFTDSQIVLSWLHTPPHTLQTFVANRVVGINNYLSPYQVEWRHISTHINPADCCSRGLLPDSLASHPLWWAGPEFLQTPVEEWPPNSYQPPDDLPEIKKTALVLITEQKDGDLTSFFPRCSTLLRLQRVFGWVRRQIYNRFIAKNLASKLSGPLSVQELNDSMCTLIRMSQRADDLKPSSKNLQKLTPFIDKDGILRVGGRLKNAGIQDSYKHPAILAKKSWLARLICDHYHKYLLHTGPRTTQSCIQRKYWILSAHSLIRQRIHQCVTCHRFSAKPDPPFMADLPAGRIQQNLAFKIVSTDFAGPFQTKESLIRRNVVHKSYFVIFVCHYSKAVHLEAVSELSTPAFIGAFSRFVARRGLCSDVYSDQGTNFVGASRHLRECTEFLINNRETIFNMASAHSVQWHFSPPAAPNFNGLAEAGVKSAKLLLYREMKNVTLTFEAFGTLLARVESCLNSRPIGFLSSDPSDISAIDVLTPGHLLIGRALLSLPEPVIPENTSVRGQWQQVQKMSQNFWRRWVSEYIHTQIQREKWTRFTTPPAVGQLVYIYGVNTAPLAYPIGRVLTLHPSKDGVIRSCTVQTSTGVYVRPVNRLIAIPSDC